MTPHQGPPSGVAGEAPTGTRWAGDKQEDMQECSLENEVNLWVDLMKEPNLVQPFLQGDLIPPEGYRGCSMELGR